jgi:hypothetical protein
MLIVGNRRRRSNVADIVRRLWPRLSILIGLAAFFIITNQALAHERWILSPEQIAELNALPWPKSSDPVRARSGAATAGAAVALVGLG